MARLVGRVCNVWLYFPGVLPGLRLGREDELDPVPRPAAARPVFARAIHHGVSRRSVEPGSCRRVVLLLITSSGRRYPFPRTIAGPPGGRRQVASRTDRRTDRRRHQSLPRLGRKSAARSVASQLNAPSCSMIAALSLRSSSSAGCHGDAGQTIRSDVNPGPAIVSPGPQRRATSSSQVERSGASMPARRSLHHRFRLTPDWWASVQSLSGAGGRTRTARGGHWAAARRRSCVTATRPNHLLQHISGECRLFQIRR